MFVFVHLFVPTVTLLNMIKEALIRILFCMHSLPRIVIFTICTPGLADVEGDGICDMLFNMIQEAEVDLRADFYKHIVLSGGSTMYPGLPSRLEKDMRKLYLDRVLKGDESRLSKFKVRSVICALLSRHFSRYANTRSSTDAITRAQTYTHSHSHTYTHSKHTLSCALRIRRDKSTWVFSLTALTHPLFTDTDIKIKQLRIEDPPRRKHMVFLGGSVLADIMKGRQRCVCGRFSFFSSCVLMSTLFCEQTHQTTPLVSALTDRDDYWISKAEWEEQGERIIGKK
jgi:actin-related protein